MSLDDTVRALERAHAAVPTRESLHAVRAAKFRAGLDPFPRVLFTPEWESVFDGECERSISSAPCGHAAAPYGESVPRSSPLVNKHACPHSGSMAPIDLRLEDVERVGRTMREEFSGVQRIPKLKGPDATGEAFDEVHIRDVRLVGNLGLRGGCTLYVEAYFVIGLPGLPESGIVAMTGSHMPCPLSAGMPAGSSIPYVIRDKLEARGILPRRQLTGRDLTIGGRPMEIRPELLEWVEVGSPGPTGPADMTYYAAQTLDGVLTSPLCECGHSGRSHASSTNGPRVCNEPECGCEDFRRVTVCACGHVRECHEGDGACTLGGDGEPIEDPQGVEICDCSEWVPAFQPGDVRPSFDVLTETGRTSSRAARSQNYLAQQGPAEALMAHDDYFPRTRMCAECLHGEDVHTERGCMGAGTIELGDGSPALPEITPACLCPAFEPES